MTRLELSGEGDHGVANLHARSDSARQDPTPLQISSMHWQEGGEELDSFAAIADEPPSEVADAGRDRSIIPIEEENIDAWLNRDPKNLDAMQAILEDRARPYYEYRMAA